MAYNDDVFNTYGKIPTDSDFWKQSIDNFISTDGITTGFGKVIGEQVFKPLPGPMTPFYSRFAGKPISAGQGWTERALKTTVMKKFNPRATASDALSFYDSEGIEKTFTTNVQGWCPVSVPSDLISPEMFIERSGVGQLNSMLVDNVINTYQRSIESEIQKKAISLTKNVIEVDTTDIVSAFGTIMDTASQMLSDDYHFNELSEDENKNLITRSNKIYCFVNQSYLNAYRNAKATLPSPNELVSNVEIVPMINKLVKPITSEEFTAGGWDTTDKPVATDANAPIAYLVGDDKITYRPMVGSYKVNMQANSAGDFTNTHLIYRGSVAVRPWENAVRVNVKA